MRRILAYFVPILVLLAVALASDPARAIAPGEASKFVDDLGGSAIRTLGDVGLNDKQRQAALRELLRQGFALKGIGKFVLGRHWRGASKAQRERYLKLFEAFILHSYGARFSQYSGQTIEVVGERADGANGRLVTSKIVRDDGSILKVQWRVREAKSRLMIVDVVVDGISLAITQRSEMAAVMQQKKGNLDALLDEIESKLKDLE